MRGGPASADVVVVGLGPVGAVLAILLGEHGVDVLVLDAGHDATPRAIAADGETLRTLLDVLGPGGRGLFLSDRSVQVRDARQRLVTTIAFPPVGDPVSNPTAQPGLSFFHQPALEGALRRRLTELPSVRVWSQARVRAVRDAPGAVVAVLEDGTAVQGSWVVGCDGAGSTVRRARGIAYGGRTFAQPWLVIDVDSPPVPELDAFRYVLDPARPAVAMPRPGGHRVEFLLHPGERAADLTTPAALRALLRPYFAAVPWAQVRVVRATDYVFHARTAERWRDGRVLLAGDSAHTMPPFGGQGMGAGIADAASLSWRLAEVCQGLAPPAVLDDYPREQRPRIEAMTSSALSIGRLLTPGHTGTAGLVTLGLKAVSRAPGVGTRFRSGALRPDVPVPVPHDERSVGGGRWLPNPVIAPEADGSTLRLDDVLGRRWSVLAGSDPQPLLSAWSRGVLQARGAQWRVCGPEERYELGLGAGKVCVARPDRVIAVAGSAADVDRVLGRLVGRPSGAIAKGRER